MKRFSKPARGCRIFATDKHMTAKAGDFIGWCEKLDDNVVIFRDGKIVDRFIWRFQSRDGTESLNDWYEYSA